MNESLATAPRTTADDEERFISEALTAVGVNDEDAADVADVLLAADVRGIQSHGIARLRWFYVDRIRLGTIEKEPFVETLRETPTALALDAGNGLGHPVSVHAMERTIAKAHDHGIAFTTVRNSNHYGIAGYYAMMALEYDMIGISSTNSVHFGVPTFGRKKKLGTNPFAFAVPAHDELPFVLDFSTTTVTRGKLEVYERLGKTLLPGWAVDRDGNPTDDPREGLGLGALLPLGGYGTDGGGHKGYGLGLLAEILCGVLAGGAFGDALSVAETSEGAQGHTGHWFAAINIAAMRDLDAFKHDMDREIRAFRESTPARGESRVYVAGEIEYEHTAANLDHGVPHLQKVWGDVDALAAELGIAPMERFAP